MKKILIRVYLVLLSLCIISLIVLSVLGSKSRVGYLGELSFNENESYSNNYIYNFQIKYYNKVFRNSDIYGVYLITNSLPEYIKEIRMNDNLGTPFGSLISSKEISENKIDNVKYILKVKSKISNYSIIFLIFIAILLISNIEKIYFRYINFFNRRYFYIIVIFLCFLILPRIIYICFYEYFDHENYENRNFSKYPDINSNFFNYPKVYEEYFNDYLPFRNEFVQLNSIIDYYIFGNLLSKRALLGIDGWLFLKDSNTIEKYMCVENSYFSYDELKIAKDNIVDIANRLKEYNIDFIFMICPDKNVIYSEYLPFYIHKKHIANSTEQFINYMKENTDIKIIYPKNELLKYKYKYNLYYKLDTHWNNLGGYIGYKKLMNAIGIDVFDLEKLVIKKYKTYNGFGDINRFANLLTLQFSDYDYNINYSNFSNFYQEKYTNISIIHDSFMGYMMKYIDKSFNKVTYSTIDNINIDKNSDIVVFETVERLLKGRVITGFSNFGIKE